MKGDREMYLYGTQKVNERGHLEIGGVDTTELARIYGTPLIVYDIAHFTHRANGFKKTFEELGVTAQVAYASKAYSSVAIYQLAHALGLSLDVVSGGELYTALKAGFPAKRIHFHGNNKGRQEIEEAFDAGIGCIVLDNFYEIELVDTIAQEKGKKMPVLLRVTPGVEPSTHSYITTGQEDSKFGFDLKNGQADEAYRLVREKDTFELLGLHAHIGSQIFDAEAFRHAAEALMDKMVEWRTRDGFICPVLNLGGGFGIRYTEEDTPLEPEQYVRGMTEAVVELSKRHEYPMPEIWIEPGRSLIGEAGTTIYEVGSAKEVPGTRTYVAVDGGMHDNIRPALYDADYSAAVANKMTIPHETIVTIAGKCCESGDQLMQDASLAPMEPGDLLAMFCTGAYTYSMASNYNRFSKPAVVFVKNGHHTLVGKRETYEDLLRLDVALSEEWID